MNQLRPRVLVTRPAFADIVQGLRETCEVAHRESQASWKPGELAAAVADCDGLLCQLTDPVSESVIAAAPRLRVISTISVGFDHVDLDAAARRDIPVTHTPGVLTETTADFAFALLLAAARRVVEADRFVRAGEWKQWELDLLCGHDVHGRTLGVVGAGRIGLAMARRARGFGMRVLCHSRSGSNPDVEAELGVEFTDFDTLLRDSDFVTLHVPLDDRTTHMIAAKELERMKPTSLLINTARGPVVDEAALCDALDRGEIAGAALDVFESEPHPDARLLERSNVVLAPHLASASVATRRTMTQMAVDDLLRVLAGQPPKHPVAS